MYVPGTLAQSVNGKREQRVLVKSMSGECEQEHEGGTRAGTRVWTASGEHFGDP